MTTLAIFEELVNSGFETNVLKTRENIIIQLACNHIKSRVLYQKQQLVDIYSSYVEIYKYALQAKSIEQEKMVFANYRLIIQDRKYQINLLMNMCLRSLFSKVQELLNKFKTLESEFDPNILLWIDIRGFYNTETISPTAKLLLPDEFIQKMKQLDIKYNNFKKEFDVIFENYLHPHTFSYEHVFTYFDEINNVLAKSLKLDFDT
jgi:hypothetical protein